MIEREAFSRIDLHLIRILHTVLSSGSVSRAALSLGMTQPSVSTALKRLRILLDDPIVVRSGMEMVPTEFGYRLKEPAETILREAARLLDSAREFDPGKATGVFRIAAPDYLDPLFLPRVFSEIRQRAPHVAVEVVALTEDFDYPLHLGHDIDLVIGNWLDPPQFLHLGRLLSDEVVCLVARDHPAVGAHDRGQWDVAYYLNSAHIAPMPMHPGARGVIDQLLDRLGLTRAIAARCAHFGLIPGVVANSTLMLTTGRLFCSRYIDHEALTILPCPVPFEAMHYYQLWHPRSQHGTSKRWLRDLVRDVARSLTAPASPHLIASP